MKCINNPALLSGGNPVPMDGVMATPTHSSKVFVAAQPLTHSSSFMVNVLALGFLAFFAYRVESHVGFLNLCVLFVFTLALGGCIPQPSAAFEWSF